MDASSIIRPPPAAARKAPVRRDAVHPVAPTVLSPQRAVMASENGDSAHDHHRQPDPPALPHPLVDGAPEVLAQPVEQDAHEQALLCQQAYAKRPATKQPAPQADIET